MKFHYKWGNLPPDLRKILPIDLNHLPDEEQKRLINTRAGFIDRLELGKSLLESAETAGCSSSELTRRFYRYATVEADGAIGGWKNVSLGARVKDYTRSDESAANATARNAMGMFSRLLNLNEEARDKLIELIVERLDECGRRIQRKTKKKIADDFAIWRASHALEQPAGGYGSSHSSSSVYRFINEFLDGNIDSYDIWFGKNSKKQLRVSNGKSSFRLATMPFDKVMIDAHRVDVIGTIRRMTPDGPKVQAISRMWLVVVLDLVSGAVLGFSISFDEQVSAETVEEAILMSQTPWKRRALVKPLKYVEGAGMPTGVIEGLTSCPIAMLSMDNFSSHYATLIQATARKAKGFHTMYGGVGAWWTNATLERFFGVLAQRGIHKLSSTMGTGPGDPLRPVNPAKNAIEDALDWRYVVDLLEVLITEHNTLPSSTRSDMSPLEIIDNHLRDPETCMVPAFDIPVAPFSPRLGFSVSEKRVGGYQKKGVLRYPYVEIDGRYFTNDKLTADFDYIDTKIWVHVRRADFYVEAFNANGTPLGQLNRCGGEDEVPMSQGAVKADRKGRNRSGVSNAKLHELREEALAAQADKDASDRPYAISAAATQIAADELMRMKAIAAGQSNPSGQSDGQTVTAHGYAAPPAPVGSTARTVSREQPGQRSSVPKLNDIAAFSGLRKRK